MTSKTIIIITACILLAMLIGLLIFRGSTSAADPRVDIALNTIDSLQAGNYQQATKDFNSQVAGVFFQKLSETWPTLRAKVGSLSSRSVTRVDGNKVYVTCTFERGSLWGVVEFDATNKIVNFSMYGHPI